MLRSSDDAWVEIGSFLNPLEAELARARLEDAGIETRFRDAHAVAVMPHLAVPIGGVGLEVRGADAERARATLAEEFDPAELDRAAGFGEEEPE